MKKLSISWIPHMVMIFAAANAFTVEKDLYLTKGWFLAISPDHPLSSECIYNWETTPVLNVVAECPSTSTTDLVCAMEHEYTSFGSCTKLDQDDLNNADPTGFRYIDP